MNNFSFKAIFVLFLVTLFTGFGFATVDLAIVNTTIYGNQYGENITFTIDYNNIDIDDANEDYNISYDINGIEYLYTISEDLNAGLQDSNSLVWDANLYGDLDINICVLYTGDANTANDCNSFTIHIYSVDLNAVSLELYDDIPLYNLSQDFNFIFTNSGDWDLTDDFNLYLYINDSLEDTQLYSDAVLSGDLEEYLLFSYVPDQIGENTAEICLEYVNDINSDNNCISFDYNVYYVDLAITDLNLNDADLNINYGADLNIVVDFNNLGDANQSEYTLTYMIDGDVVEEYTLYDLNAGLSDTNSYIWDSNIGSDVNVMVCIDFSDTDYNTDNDCLSEIVHVKVADMDVTSLVLNDYTVNESTSVTATVDYTNIGDLAATEDYTVRFYKKEWSANDSTYSEICTSTRTVTSTLDIDEDTEKTCAFSITSISSDKDYKIKVVITYLGDSNSANDYLVTTTRLEVTNSTTTSSSSSGSTSEAKPDFIISSFNVPVKADVNKELLLSSLIKNNGNKTSTEEYSIKITVTDSAKKVTTICEDYFDNSLSSGKTTKFDCKWLPKALGKYTLIAKVTYEGSEKTKSNNSLTKVIEIISPIVNTQVDNGVQILGETKTVQDYSDLNKFVNDLNKSLTGTGLLTPDNNDIYLPVKVTRDFNCYTDANKKQQCKVKLTLLNEGKSNLVNYNYYELVPDGNNHKAVKFDLNLDANKQVVFEYALANPITKTDYPKFMGVVLAEDISEPVDNTTSGSSWKFPTQTVLVVVGIVVGAAILALVVAYLIDYLRNRPSGFKYYKTHSSREDEGSSRWNGFGNDEHRVKYSSKYKVHEHKHSGPKYKGWK